MSTVRVNKQGVEVIFERITQYDQFTFTLIVEADLTGHSWVGQFRRSRDETSELVASWTLSATVANGETTVACLSEIDEVGTFYFDIVSHDGGAEPVTWCWGHAFVVPRVTVIA